jgi:hypothetical protein
VPLLFGFAASRNGAPLLGEKELAFSYTLVILHPPPAENKKKGRNMLSNISLVYNHGENPLPSSASL